MPDLTEAGKDASSLELSRSQRSHVLFVLTDANSTRQAEFLEWYQGTYRNAVLALDGVLSLQHYEQHEVDVTQGRFERFPFLYLGICELSLDGAEAAGAIIDAIAALHRDQAATRSPATWLYYPVSEKVGRCPHSLPSMVTLAFANGKPGQEDAFREWYATRHIRHALNIPVFSSGQCFQRTQFQRPGVRDASFDTIAIYEQEGPPEVIIESFASLPASTLQFPTLDLSRFAEWVYRPLSSP